MHGAPINSLTSAKCSGFYPNCTFRMSLGLSRPQGSFTPAPRGMELCSYPRLQLRVVRITPEHVHQSLRCLTLLSLSQQCLFPSHCFSPPYHSLEDTALPQEVHFVLLLTDAAGALLRPKPPSYLLCIPVRSPALVALNAV